ncbi:hypothetical protein B484DRAFT_414492 [Ochromonadaceae sp. CCMP2298]|nr:hypothetical protein B484DRAFT_414492 [Ochromonadaceae sp. CCMP2298]
MRVLGLGVLCVWVVLRLLRDLGVLGVLLGLDWVLIILGILMDMGVGESGFWLVVWVGVCKWVCVGG